MEKKNVVKRVRNSVALALVLLSVISISSCKKDAQVSPASIASSSKSQGVGNSPKSNYKVSQPVSLNGAHDITISGDSISGGALSCVSLVNCYNIHITNCKLVNSGAMGIDLSGCSNIIVDDCFIANVVTGVHSFNGRSISVMNNKMSNISGRQPGGTMAEFENVADDATDAASNSAINNQIIN